MFDILIPSKFIRINRSKFSLKKEYRCAFFSQPDQQELVLFSILLFTQNFVFKSYLVICNLCYLICSYLRAKLSPKTRLKSTFSETRFTSLPKLHSFNKYLHLGITSTRIQSTSSVNYLSLNKVGPLTFHMFPN